MNYNIVGMKIQFRSGDKLIWGRVVACDRLEHDWHLLVLKDNGRLESVSVQYRDVVVTMTEGSPYRG